MIAICQLINYIDTLTRFLRVTSLRPCQFRSPFIQCKIAVFSKVSHSVVESLSNSLTAANGDG